MVALSPPTVQQLGQRLGVRCSFCGREGPLPDQYGAAVAGVTGREVRICNGCLSLCADICADLVRTGEPSFDTAGTPVRPGTEDEVVERLECLFAPEVPAPRPARDPRMSFDPSNRGRGVTPPAGKPRGRGLACSFCDAEQGSVQKLIAGPGRYVCERFVDGLCRLVQRIGHP